MKATFTDAVRCGRLSDAFMMFRGRIDRMDRWVAGSSPELTLCQQHGLTVYDAAYLELAKRKGISLATFDSALRKAAPLESVELVAY
jgi:hypothetical protein